METKRGASLPCTEVDPTVRVQIGTFACRQGVGIQRMDNDGLSTEGSRRSRLGCFAHLPGTLHHHQLENVTVPPQSGSLVARIG